MDQEVGMKHFPLTRWTVQTDAMDAIIAQNRWPWRPPEMVMPRLFLRNSQLQSQKITKLQEDSSKVS